MLTYFLNSLLDLVVYTTNVHLIRDESKRISEIFILLPRHRLYYAGGLSQNARLPRPCVLRQRLRAKMK